MSKSIIAVDVDDVLGNYHQELIKFARKTFHIDLKTEDIQENWGKAFQISDERWLREYDIFVKDFGAYRNMSKITGALDGLRKLRKKFQIIILTSRASKYRNITLNWLEKNFDGVYDQVVFAGIWDEYSDNDLHDLAKKTKAGICQEIGANYLIDDQPKHANAAAESGIQCLLFGDYGWNRNIDIVDGVTHVSDWGGVVDYFGV